MDANTVCPACYAGMVEARRRTKARLVIAYGEVPESEYRELLDLMRAEPTPEPRETLSQIKQMTMSKGGGFHVSYRCECSACAFEFEFKHQEMAWPPAAVFEVPVMDAATQPEIMAILDEHLTIDASGLDSLADFPDGVAVGGKDVVAALITALIGDTGAFKAKIGGDPDEKWCFSVMDVKEQS